MNPVASVSVKRSFTETPLPAAFEPKKAKALKEVKALERKIIDQKNSAFKQQYADLLDLGAEGDTDALRKLGDLCLRGKDENGVGREKDEVMAFLYFNQAAQEENAKAMYTLAQLYDKGIGTTKSRRMALRYYEKVAPYVIEHAEKGDIEAQLRLAEMYRNGNGVKKSHQEAYKWYEAIISSDICRDFITKTNIKGPYALVASERLEKMMTRKVPEYSNYIAHLTVELNDNDKSNLLCMLALSHQLVAGNSTPTAAFKYLQQAVDECSCPEAMYQLGLMYETKKYFKGVAQDLFDKAANLGHQKTIEKIKAETLE